MSAREVVALYPDTPSAGKGRIASPQSGDTYFFPRSVKLDDNVFFYIGADQDIAIDHNTAGPYSRFSFFNHHAYIDQQTNGKAIYMRCHDGTAVRRRCDVDAGGVIFYAGASIRKLETKDGVASELIGDWECQAKLSQNTSAGARFDLVDEFPLADEASVALESKIGGVSGILEVFYGTAAYGRFVIGGSGNSVTELDDPGTNYLTTDTDGSVCILSDGDSTYTLKNRSGAAQDFVLRFHGRT